MPWTFMHFITLIPTLVVFVLLSIFLGKKLKNTDERIKLIPIHIITITLIILEIIKQVKSIEIGYDLSDLPFYYCSLFLYLYLAMSLYQGKNKDIVRVLTLLSGTTLFAVMLVMPQVIYSENAIRTFFESYDSFHTVFYHNLVLLGTMLIFTLNLYKFNRKKHLKTIISFYTIYCLIGASMAMLLKQNYNQFSRSNVDFIEDIRVLIVEILGNVAGQAVYILCVAITTIGFSTLMYIVLSSIICKIQKAEKEA